MSKNSIVYPEMSLEDVMLKYKWLSNECVSAVKRVSFSGKYFRHGRIVSQGEVTRDLIFISSGVVRISFQKGQKEDTICFGGRGDVFMSFHSIYAGEPSAFSLVGLTDGSFFRISMSKFEMLEKRFPELTIWMNKLLVEQFYSFEVLYRKLVMSSPDERLANFWDFHTDYLRNLPPASISRVVPLKIIAQYLGMTPQTLSKLRRRIVGK